jgi:hypothetical protein
MKKRQKIIYSTIFLLTMIPFVSFAQDGIEPPPTTPIDSATIYVAILGVVFASYYFYRTNLKLQKNETKSI